LDYDGLVKKVMYHSRDTQRSAETSHMFFKIKQKLWENIQKKAAFKCPVSCKTSQIFVTFVCIFCCWI